MGNSFGLIAHMKIQSPVKRYNVKNGITYNIKIVSLINTELKSEPRTDKRALDGKRTLNNNISKNALTTKAFRYRMIQQLTVQLAII